MIQIIATAAILLSNCIANVIIDHQHVVAAADNDSVDNAIATVYTITSIFPEGGPTDGGTNVVLHVGGDINYYSNDWTCVFGDDDRVIMMQQVMIMQFHMLMLSGCHPMKYSVYHLNGAYQTLILL